MVLVSVGRGLYLVSGSPCELWKIRQPPRTRFPAASTRYLEPVTDPAAPRKVSFAIGGHSTEFAYVPQLNLGAPQKAERSEFSGQTRSALSFRQTTHNLQLRTAFHPLRLPAS